jgi:hypothetical protein
MNARDVQQHVTILGWLYVIGHALFLTVGALLFILLAGIGLAVDDPEARLVLPVVGGAVGALLILLGLPGLIAGYGLVTAKPWARVLALVIGILNLVNVPTARSSALTTAGSCCSSPHGSTSSSTA